MTDDKLSPYLTYDLAEMIESDSEIITKVAAITEYTAHMSTISKNTGHFMGITHIGTGTESVMRSMNKEELKFYPRGTKRIDYYKGFTICGISAMDITDEVFMSDLIMTEGRMITDEDTANRAKYAVISERVAEQNELSLGDMVYLDSLSLYLDDKEANLVSLKDETNGRYAEQVPYEIIGLYEHKTDNGSSVDEPYLIHDNKIYVPISSLADIAKGEFSNIYLDENHNDIGTSIELSVIPSHLYFFLTDIGEAKTLEKALNDIGFSKTIKLIPYISDAVSSPSARLAEIISTLIVGVVIFGFAVLILAVIFHMRARHRELAVLSALGQKRNTVAGSFFAEVAILMGFALLTGSSILVFSVSFLAEPITNYLLASEGAASIVTETADTLFAEKEVSDVIIRNIGDETYLFTEYTIPSILFSMMAGVVILIGIYAVVYRYVKKINALSGVGGKE